MSSKFRSDIPTMNSANNVAKWKTGFIGHKKGIGPIFISEFADLFAAAHMYATRTYFLFWQPVYAPTDAVFDENHELAAVRECNSYTDQSELPEENDNTDKGTQNWHEVA